MNEQYRNQQYPLPDCEKADKKRKRIVPKAPVQMIISREYVGTQTVTEAFIPIISEDIRKKIAEGDTFDNEGLSA